MHEAAIAKEVFDIAAGAMAENGLVCLNKIVMDIGEYTAVDPRQLDIVFAIAVKGTPLDGCKLETHFLKAQAGMYVRTIEGK